MQEDAKGRAHLDVAPSLHSLGDCYTRQDKHSKAEPLLRSSLEIREKTLGRGDPRLISSLVALGNCYMLRNKYAEAEPLYDAV